MQFSTSIQDAVYVPPAAHPLDDLISNLIRFISRPPSNMPILVVCAVAHYQFESIHPFGDGNGRIGRLLVPLILARRRMLSKPLLFLSSYIEENKSEYYVRLQDVRQASKWTKWLEFFMKGVTRCSKEDIDATARMQRLRSEYAQNLRKSNSSKSALVLADYLFSAPVISIPAAADHLKVTCQSAKNTVMRLVCACILEAAGDQKRGKIYVAKSILDALS